MAHATMKKNDRETHWPAKPRRITREENSAVREKVQKAKDRVRRHRMDGRQRTWVDAVK